MSLIPWITSPLHCAPKLIMSSVLFNLTSHIFLKNHSKDHSKEPWVNILSWAISSRTQYQHCNNQIRWSFGRALYTNLLDIPLICLKSYPWRALWGDLWGFFSKSSIDAENNKLYQAKTCREYHLSKACKMHQILRLEPTVTYYLLYVWGQHSKCLT